MLSGVPAPNPVSEFPSPAALKRKDSLRILLKEFGALKQAECPLRHFFAPGVYLREITMPAGAYVIGKIHKTEHFNLIERGCVALIQEDGSVKELRAPYVFVSQAGVQKVLYIKEETVWRTIHVTQEKDLNRLESDLIEADDYPVFDRTDERMALLEAAIP